MKRRLLIWAAHAPTDGHRHPGGGRCFKYRPPGRYPKHRPPHGVARTPSPPHALARRSSSDSRRPPPMASLLMHTVPPPLQFASTVRWRRALPVPDCGRGGLSMTAASGFCSEPSSMAAHWRRRRRLTPSGYRRAPTKSAETIAGRGMGSSPWPRAAALTSDEDDATCDYAAATAAFSPRLLVDTSTFKPPVHWEEAGRTTPSRRLW